MGTLFDQEITDKQRVDLHDLEFEALKLIKLSSKIKVPLKELITLKHALELERMNNLKGENHDVNKEVVAAFGEIFQDLVDKIQELCIILS